MESTYKSVAPSNHFLVSWLITLLSTTLLSLCTTLMSLLTTLLYPLGLEFVVKNIFSDISIM